LGDQHDRFGMGRMGQVVVDPLSAELSLSRKDCQIPQAEHL